MATRLTEFLGGALRVRGAVGGGTEFTVALPVFAADPRSGRPPHDA
jgi:signal transduction histidine kinase